MHKLRLKYPKQPSYLGDFIEAAADSLNMRGMDNLLRFRFVRHIQNNPRMLGICYSEPGECEIHIVRHPTKKARRDIILKTIAHEMIHAHQFFTGRLKIDYINRNWCWVWEGSRYTGVCRSEPSLPWEKEAYFMENVIYNEIVGA